MLGYIAVEISLLTLLGIVCLPQMIEVAQARLCRDARFSESSRWRSVLPYNKYKLLIYRETQIVLFSPPLLSVCMAWMCIVIFSLSFGVHCSSAPLIARTEYSFGVHWSMACSCVLNGQNKSCYT